MDVDELGTAAAWINRANAVVAFTGAGISVESGIPGFCSPGGLWSKFNPAIYCDFDNFQVKPELFWEMSREMQSTVAKAQPNPAHVTLADMEEHGLLSCVITQNIDNLHKQAGSTKVFELHDNAATSTCMMCHEKMATIEAIAQLQDQDAKVPKCKVCDGVMKMDVVLFGEALQNGILEGAMVAAMTADVILVVGTSLTVSPANMVVDFCRRRNGRVIIVDPDLSVKPQADLLLCGQAGVVLPQLLQACLANHNIYDMNIDMNINGMQSNGRRTLQRLCHAISQPADANKSFRDRFNLPSTLLLGIPSSQGQQKAMTVKIRWYYRPWTKLPSNWLQLIFAGLQVS